MISIRNPLTKNEISLTLEEIAILHLTNSTKLNAKDERNLYGENYVQRILNEFIDFLAEKFPTTLHELRYPTDLSRSARIRPHKRINTRKYNVIKEFYENKLTVDKPPLNNHLILTTKSTYLWGVLFVRLIKENVPLDEQIIRNALEKTYNKFRSKINNYYQEYTHSLYAERNTLEIGITDDFIRNLLEDNLSIFDKDIYGEITNETRLAYNSLLNKELIVDPVEIEISSAILLSAIGLIPYGFTKTTKKGEIIKREISAVLWKYEKKIIGDKEEIQLKFNLVKILTLFKKMLINIFDNLDDNSED